MNALVAIRANAMGLLSPTQEQRGQVAQRLADANLTAASPRSVSAEKIVASSSSPSKMDSSSVGPDDELGRDAFLQLLVLQLQNQDPTNPVDSTAMLAQLAQFSALEALTNLDASFQLLSGNMDQLNFISASQLIGRRVEGIDVNGQIREGVVESVQLNGSLVVLTVDGSPMSMAGILRIEADSSGADAEPPAQP